MTYPEDRSIGESQAIYGEQAKALELLNQDLGLIGCYQNHAGNHVGAPIWDLPPIFLQLTTNLWVANMILGMPLWKVATSWELGLRQINLI